MSVLEASEKTLYDSFRNNVELAVVEPTKLLFKLIVNNYKKSEDALEEQEKSADDIMTNDDKGLPPQPKQYLKFPKYDWL